MLFIDKKTDLLNKLCQKHHVKKLYVFGSATNQSFKDTSDIDFLVTFKTINFSQYFENYTTFKHQLKHLFKREIDLIESQTLKNPILISTINENKELVYG